MPNYLLLTMFEKLLIYLELETHLTNDNIENCNEDFSLLTPHVCKIKSEEYGGKQSSEEIDLKNKINDSTLIKFSDNNSIMKENLCVIEDFPVDIKKCFISSTSNLVLTLDENSKVVLYKIDKYCEKISELPHVKIDEIEIVEKSFKFDIISVNFDNNSTNFATCSNDNYMRIWDSKGFLKNFVENKYLIEICRFSKQENLILYLVNDEIILWNFLTNESICSYSNIRFCKEILWRNNSEFMTLHSNGSMKFWLLNLNYCFKTLEENNEGNYALETVLSTKNYYMTLLSNNKMCISKITIWDIFSSSKLEEYEIYEGNIDLMASLNYQSGFTSLALVINKRELKFLVWHPTIKMIPIKIFPNDIHLIKVSESSKYLVIVDVYGIITILRLELNSEYVCSTMSRVDEEIIDIKWTQKESSIVLITKQNIIIKNEF